MVVRQSSHLQNPGVLQKTLSETAFAKTGLRCKIVSAFLQLWGKRQHLSLFLCFLSLLELSPFYIKKNYITVD